MRLTDRARHDRIGLTGPYNLNKNKQKSHAGAGVSL